MIRKEIFQNFSKWLKKVVDEKSFAKFKRSEDRLAIYQKVLEESGLSKQDSAYQISVIEEILFQIDVERWNRYYKPQNNEKLQMPNKFLTETVKNLRGKKALDVGMGQGRNAIFLAHQGWEVTGVEISAEGIAKAQQQATQNNLQINTIFANYEQFDFGKNTWDLIVLIYVPLRNISEKVIAGLSRQGSLVVETFLAEDQKVEVIGDKVTLEKDELSEMFSSLNTYHYEEVVDFNDFGAKPSATVKLHAGKF
jgi:SAM-dependent methyltransferase